LDGVPCALRRRARPELFFARAEELFLPREALAFAREALALRWPFDLERPRLLDRVVVPRSLAAGMFKTSLSFGFVRVADSE
jgi:hypothetical protein